MSSPPKFEISKEEILDLLTGERFYGDDGAAVREGILNAIDACHRQKVKTEGEYNPEISVIFDISENEFIIEDNGDGMGIEEIDSLFTKVGKSARDLNTEGSENQIGEFGIGVVSYFLISDEFDVYSKKEGEEPVGYRFSKEMFQPGESAVEAPGDERSERGTKVVFRLKDSVTIDNLKSAYKNWIRAAEPVTAKEQPTGNKIEQKGLPDLTKQVEVEDLPSWIERAELGLRPELGTTDNLPGKATIDVLYRGVYLNDRSINGLWGIRGAIHVSPDEIKPKLNREEFLKSGPDSKLKEFLEELHPQVLSDGSALVEDEFDESERPKQQRKLITRWMAVPRNQRYEDTSQDWDKTLEELPVVEEITASDRRPFSIKDLKSIDREEIFFIKKYRSGKDTLATEAANVLRKKDSLVFTGVSSANRALRRASPEYSDSGEFVINEFNDELPEIKRVKDEKRTIIEEDNPIIKLFSGQPTIKAVSLGESSEPFVTLSDEIWLNVDCSTGESILTHLLEKEPRERGLIIACHLYSQSDIQQISSRLKQVDSESEREIGPVRKSRIMEEIL
jgi:hypothetical protein